MNKGFSVTVIEEAVKKFFFALCFIIPAFCMFYANCEMPLDHHELFIPQGKGLFFPEHGRYIASFLNNFLFEKSSVILNVHTADLRASLILVFVIIFSIMIFSVISCGIILFTKNENKNKMWYWLICYLSTFLILYDSQSEKLLYYDLIEFFEYPCSLIPYLPFLAMIFKLFIKDENPSKFEYTLLLILSFFTGITLEQINIPAFLFLFAITLFVGVEYLKEKDNTLLKQKFKNFSIIFAVNLISCLIYYVNPSDHIPVDKYLLLYGSSGFFQEITKRTILDYWVAYVIMISGIIAILFCKKREGNKLILAVVANTLSLLIYYYIVYYCIFCFYDVSSLIDNCKYFLLLFCILIFENFVLWGYFFNTKIIKCKFLNHICLPIGLSVCFFFLFNSFIDLTNVQNRGYSRKQKQYYFEKYLMREVGKETIVVPNFEIEDIDRNLMYTLFILHYPDFQGVKTILVDKNLLLTDIILKEQTENKKLRFSDFLEHKVMKYEGQYFYDIQKFKEDDNYSYYEIVE